MPDDLSALIEANPMSDAHDPRAWVGRIEDRSGMLSADLAMMLAGAVGHPAAARVPVQAGAPIPVLWHWAAFPDCPPLDSLGPDGHPRLGGFLPPVPLPRRMWAGGSVAFHGALAIGERLHRRSEIVAVEFKTGSAGEMAFVTVRHAIAGEGGGRIDEVQDIVYLPMPTAFRPPRAIPAPEAPLFDEVVETGPVRLFRYSSATVNAHRIHYDRDYAREVEKYPALVVHGPLQATLLAEAGIRHTGRTPRRITHRGVHPMFDTEPLRLMGVDRPEGGLFLCTVASAGHQGMQVTLEWE
jgi:3-methylfumaryl-CoA hydratase